MWSRVAQQPVQTIVSEGQQLKEFNTLLYSGHLRNRLDFMMVSSRVQNAMQVERGHRKQATENCYGFKHVLEYIQLETYRYKRGRISPTLPRCVMIFDAS